MKNLVIIGSGGMGREIYNLAIVCNGYNTEYKIKGFLDDWPEGINAFKNYPPVIGTVEDYIIEPDDVFVCSFGNVSNKKKNIQKILDKGGQFISLIHQNASIGLNSIIGQGSIILQNAVIGVNSKIGNYALIQISTIIGHDCVIGDYSRIDCHVVCVGGVIIDDEVTIHTSAVINHKVVIEKRAIVGALSFVIRRVKANTTVSGNPAIKLK
ncbi:MAG: acetyltransferase [Bacteroidales bacterium]|nr:acetyltransferase [Bacteroidales bacterium]